MNKNLDRRLISLEAARRARTTTGPTDAELTATLLGRLAAFDRRQTELAKMTPEGRAEALRAELEERRQQWAVEVNRPAVGRLSANTPAMEARIQRELELRILEAEGAAADVIAAARLQADSSFAGVSTRANGLAG
jgi:hypothetical protein